MQDFHLQDEFTDIDGEQGVIAAVARTPDLYFALYDLLPPDVFTHEADTWREVALAREADCQPTIPPHWLPSPSPQVTAQRLVDLYQRRLLAAAQERLAQSLYDDSIPATTIGALLEEEAIRVQSALRTPESSRLQWASEVLPEVLADAAARYQQREQTGSPVQGLPTGITHLDDMLNGLNEGLHLLGGPPGMGKTTLAWQMATHATRAVPVLFVTFEHAPANLTLRALCAQASINPQEVQRGRVHPETLRHAAAEWQPIAQRLALIEGSSRLTMTQVQAQARRAMHSHNAAQCLVIVDYLQLWAKVAEDLRGLFSIRERVEFLGGMLRELSMSLRSPVIALSSQNRAQGNYGNGKGTAALDSLKESGDLEYSADVVLFLIEAQERQAIPPARAVNLVVAKHRHGVTGKIALIFRPDIGILREEDQR